MEANPNRQGMSTAQLAVLWYAAVIIILIMGPVALDDYGGDTVQTILSVLCVTVLASVLTYTLRPHPAADKRKLLWLILVPPCSMALVGGIVAGVMAWRESRSEKSQNPSLNETLWRGRDSQSPLWDEEFPKYPVGCILEGKIVKITPQGALMEIERGVVGFIPLSEMSWTTVRHPSEVVYVGGKVEAMVLDLRKDEKTIIMGIKQTQFNPMTADEKPATLEELLRGFDPK